MRGAKTRDKQDNRFNGQSDKGQQGSEMERPGKIYQNLVLDNIEEYIVLADLDLNIIYINKSGPSLPKEKMVGSYLPDMIDV